MIWRVLMAGLLAVGMSAAHAADATIQTAEWDAYKAAFMTEDGRVVDNVNGNISHSESQGYGMLLAYLAHDPDGFAQIWNFTRRELMIRKDGLVAWKWDPAAKKVTDTNNATDGDILVAYSLALAGAAWGKPDYHKAAHDLANAVGRYATMSWRGQEILLPAAFGFRPQDQDDGPVVNPSYWIFEAFPVFAQLAPETDWSRIAIHGRQLIAEAKFGESGLPTDWISLAGDKLAPAANFPPEFGYNNIRVPLYLLRGGSTEPALLAHFIAPLDGAGEPGTRLVANDQLIDPLVEPGYQIIGAAIDCVLNRKKIPKAMRAFEPKSYYGSTLHLLTLSFLREHLPDCL